MDKPTPPQPGDDAETWRRKLAEWDAWRAQLVEGTREHAMVYPEITKLDQPLLRRLEADELARALELTEELVDTLRREGHEAAREYVHATLVCALGGEQGRRRDVDFDLEVQLEANGHDMLLAHDQVAERQDGRGWSALCHCDADLPRRATREEAQADGERHLEEVGGGRWSAHGD